MEASNPGTPVTDEEVWSDESNVPPPADQGSPEGNGYTPLEYQVLDEDSSDGEEAGRETAEDTGGSQQSDVGIGRGDARTRAEEQQNHLPDVRGRNVASAMLRAMESDYRACIESERRIVSNGPIAPATATTDSANQPAQLEENGTIRSEQEQRQEQDQQPVVDEEGLAPTAATTVDPPPPRSISPLGQDQAERVMRAMQGFTLAAPAPPPARFEADWGSPGALANLGEATEDS